MRVVPQPQLGTAVPGGEDHRPIERLSPLLSRQELFVRDERSPHRLVATSLVGSDTAWFGVGVTAGGKLSQALPIDVLGLIYAQELVRRAMGWRRSLVLVADENARVSGGDALAVRRRSVQVQDRLRRVVERLEFPVHVQLASSLTATHGPLPSAALRGSLPPYIAHQLAQTERLRRDGAGLKLGWAWPGAWQDERYFDDLHVREYGERIASVYVVGGRTLDPRRPRACPYVCHDPQKRLLLDPDEHLQGKLDRANRAAARRYDRLLGKLARAHCRLTATERARRPAAVLQTLLDELCAP